MDERIDDSVDDSADSVDTVDTVNSLDGFIYLSSCNQIKLSNGAFWLHIPFPSHTKLISYDLVNIEFLICLPSNSVKFENISE